MVLLVLACLAASSLFALPAGYVELAEGLAFGGDNWIETGYSPKAGDRFACEVTFAAEQAHPGAAVFGTDGADDETRAYALRPQKATDLDLVEVTYGGDADGQTFPLGVRVSLAVGPGGATWEWAQGSGRLELSGGAARDAVTPLLIGDVNVASYVGDAEPSGAGAVMVLHAFRITRNGLETVRDYVPCRRTADGWPGLYDTVEGEFLPLQPVQARPVITSIAVDWTKDEVLIGVRTVPGVRYALRRSPTVAPRSAYAEIGVAATATGTSLTLVDADKGRPKDRAFYIVAVDDLNKE